MASGSLKRAGEPEEIEAWKVMMDSMVRFIAASTKLMNTLNIKAGNNSTIMAPVQLLCEDECKQCLPEKTPKCAAVSCLQASKMNELIAVDQDPKKCAAAPNPDIAAATDASDTPDDKKEGDSPAEGAESPQGEAVAAAEAAAPEEAAASPEEAPQQAVTPATDNSECVCKTIRDQRAAGIEPSGKKGKCRCGSKKKTATPSSQQICACPLTSDEKGTMVEAFIEKVNRAEQEMLELRQQLQQMMEMDKSNKTPSAALYREIMKDTSYQQNDSQAPPDEPATPQRQVCRRPRPDLSPPMPPNPRRYPGYGRPGALQGNNVPSAGQRGDLSSPINLSTSTPVSNRGNARSYQCQGEGGYSYPNQNASYPITRSPTNMDDYSYAELDNAMIEPSTPAPTVDEIYSYSPHDTAFIMPTNSADYRTPVAQGPNRTAANSADYRTPVAQGPYRTADYVTPGTSHTSVCNCPSEQNQQPRFYSLYGSTMSTNYQPPQPSQAYTTQTTVSGYPQNYVECQRQTPKTPQRNTAQQLLQNTSQSMRNDQQYSNGNQIARTTTDQNQNRYRSRIPITTGPSANNNVPAGYLPQRNPLAQMLGPPAFAGFQPPSSTLGQTILSVQGITICRTNDNYERLQDAANVGHYQIQNGDDSCSDDDCENTDCEAHTFG